MDRNHVHGRSFRAPLGWLKLSLVGGVVLLLALTVLLSGCKKPEPAAETPLIAPEMLRTQYAPQEPPVAHLVRRDYRLREGDQLEIIYHVRHVQTDEYRIKIQDIIQIRFPFNPQLDQVEQVQSDGTLSLSLVGAVNAYGLTLGELQEKLVQEYAQYLKDPILTLSFKQSNVNIMELREAIKTAPRGQSRLVPITPDGNISLPFIAEIRAAGKTVGELHRDLNQAYQDVGLHELEVTVNVQSVSPMTVYVLGEVRIPGALLNKTGAVSANNELTLLGALSQAGSYLPPRAELSRVLLVRRRHLARPEGAIINVMQLLENTSKTGDGAVVADMSKYKYDVWLEDGDIIYVPTTDIAKRADYIEYVWQRGIRNVIGFSSSANYTVADGVDWVRPN